MEARTSSTTSLINLFSIPNNNLVPDGYYSSKLFKVLKTSNPINDAATPILTILERLSVSSTLPEIHNLRDNIEHELKAFHCLLIENKYPSEQIVIASYMICATIDEVIGKNYLRINKDPVEFKSFTPSSFNNIGPEERFFDIINHLRERSNQYLDLLELGYYCIAAGFEGKHHVEAGGRQALDNLLEDLFQMINQQKVNKPIKLFKQVPKEVTSANNYKTIIWLGAISFIMVVMVYVISSIFLESSADNFMKEHTSFEKVGD